MSKKPKVTPDAVVRTEEFAILIFVVCNVFQATSKLCLKEERTWTYYSKVEFIRKVNGDHMVSKWIIQVNCLGDLYAVGPMCTMFEEDLIIWKDARAI